jgi:hypothetical protein
MQYHEKMRLFKNPHFQSIKVGGGKKKEERERKEEEVVREWKIITQSKPQT